jgi:hypothetical protein
LLNFCLVKQIYYLSTHRLSGKIFTFLMFQKCFVLKTKKQKRS